MKKIIILLLISISLNTEAQSIFKFDKRLVECEDKWVVFKPEKDSLYSYGFIYIDAVAGLTFNYEGYFRVTTEGTFIPTKMDNASYKVRLEPNKTLVAFIPENKFRELQIPSTPDWLKGYKGDTASIGRLYNWGYKYNGWGECAKALTYLERAQKIDPQFKGLSVELAFSYNCLKLYDKAIMVLGSAIKADSTNAYINKEYVYAQIKSGKLNDAAINCKKAIAICTDSKYNGENCFNLLRAFYLKKDKENFLLWLDETKKWTSGNADIIHFIKIMEDELMK